MTLSTLMQSFRLGNYSNKISLIEELYKNSRVKDSHLVEKLKISRQSIGKMRKKLWNEHVISSPGIILNHRVLNIENYFMEIKTNPTEPEVLKKLKRIPEVSIIDGIIGDYALLVKFEVRTKQRFAEILNELDQQIARTAFQSYRIIETIDTFKTGGFIIDNNDNAAVIKEKKWKLLKLLKRNYSISRWPERKRNEFFSKIETDNLTQINLSREYDKLLKSKIIKNFSIAINPLKLLQFVHDFQMKFYMRIKPKNIGNYNQLAENLIYEPNIIDLCRTGEDFGLLAIIRTENIIDFKNLIYNFYSKYEILDTFTTVVVDEHIPTIFPPTLRVANELCKLR